MLPSSGCLVCLLGTLRIQLSLATTPPTIYLRGTFYLAYFPPRSLLFSPFVPRWPFVCLSYCPSANLCFVLCSFSPFYSLFVVELIVGQVGWFFTTTAPSLLTFRRLVTMEGLLSLSLWLLLCGYCGFYLLMIGSTARV